MPLIVTVITEDDLLDLANGKADAETAAAIETAAKTDDRVWRYLQSIRRAEQSLASLAKPSK